MIPRLCILAVTALCVAWAPAQDALAGDAAADAVETGPAVGDAQLAPHAPGDPQMRFVKALALRETRPGAARLLFEKIALEGGPLADRALHMAALCAIDQGDGAAADRLFGQVSLRYVDADQVLLERARQVLQLRVAGPRAASRVEEILQPIFAGKVRADVASAHLIAGDAQRAAGARDKARAHWRAAWVDHPLSPAAESARQRDASLGAGPRIDPQLLLRRAETLLDAHRNHEALDQLARIPVQSLCLGGCPGDRSAGGFLKSALEALGAFPAQHEPTPEDVERSPPQPADALACRVKLDQGRALRKEHEYSRARTALAPVVLRCADPDVRAKALYLLAQLESMSGKPTAAALWEALSRRYPQSSLADDAVYNQSIAARRAGEVEKERALLREVVDHYLDGDLRAEALFRLFWSYRSEGKAREGLVWLDQLAAHPDSDGYDEERARYWRARSLLEGEPGQSALAKAAAREAARTDLTWLVSERPLTYYGLLAHGRLAEVDPDRARAIDEAQDRLVQTPAPRALHAGALARDPHLLAAIELLRLGLNSEAVHELNAVDRSLAREAGEAGYEPLTLVAELYARAGDFRNAHSLVRTDLRPLLRRPGSALALHAEALAYPLAFREQISRVSQGAAIPPDLLQALMREESALDPRALSPTGAVGLTQLMPATARALARKLKLHGYQTSRLVEPEVNIRIGGAYLGELYARFQHPALALASYNAGPGAVAGWLKARGSLPLDAFVEEIPLEETRGYVKRCLRSFAAYQFLYSNGRTPSLGQTLAAR